MHRFEFSEIRLLISTAILVSTVLFTSGCSGVSESKLSKQTSKVKRYSEDINFNYTFKGGSGAVINQSGVYCDDLLFGDAKTYNRDLALSSFALAVSAFSAGDTSLHWGDNGNFGREESLANLYKDLKFENAGFYGYDVSLNDSSSKAAFGIASKKVLYDGYEHDIVAIAVRGGGYGAEWANNFVVGTEEKIYHQGFEESADLIKKIADEYIGAHCTSGSVRLWICGYSRAAAIANILSVKFNRDNAGHLVYCYTFASPNTVILNNPEAQETRDDNILNIINPYDTITFLPPHEWGFGKSGQSIVFPIKTDSVESTQMYKKVSEEYENLTGKKYNMTSGDNLRALMDIILSVSRTRADFNKTYEPVFKDLMLFWMTRVSDGAGGWIRPKFVDFLTDKYGSTAEKALKRLQGSEEMISLKAMGINIPDGVEYFIILSQIHGINDPESIFISSFDFETFNKLFNFFGGESGFADAKPHYPEVYLAWIKSYDLSDIDTKK